MVGLEEKADQHIRFYSGGMKRRANLAAGLLHRPSLLFLDEPTVGIDAQSRNMILEKLKELKQEGMSMVYTTHYMEEAEYLCSGSAVAIMDQGRIISTGSPRTLLAMSEDCINLGDLFLKLTGKKLRD
jgi:ABC-2 type transport system ATP-binding protein